MDEIFKALADLLRDNGLIGVVIGALGYGWYRLATLYHETQNSRIEDGKSAVRALEANTNTLRELIDSVKNRKGE